mmetsp:Transcript_2303/g.2788  ORF Transcript_2303/g.2788 Transcript_2303/m.2788 type:complete len:124 (+) Transcript_2303:66-437(+)|eukprot:CAMPEP_0194194242 /NCGR_PEP_ID=MMETSP0154-20130528/75477_1 /TAXON_ID=1049557 /ORGANISM="Thalassiothrix antarctica, Strain L6-D1" /LENGTH=123 /DNA_ID=CAMNT_0038918653 /DNA_START=64 /DNA_END=435 /DNA_ORIENTATION=+
MVEQKDAIESALVKYKPLLAKISLGGVVGYSAGYATKKIGRVVLFVAGVGFMVSQSLVYAGYLEIDWMKVTDDAIKSVDTDGDGKLTTDDVKTYWKRFRELMTRKLPNAGGFSLGFLMGVKSG